MWPRDPRRRPHYAPANIKRRLIRRKILLTDTGYIRPQSPVDSIALNFLTGVLIARDAI
jgi:hypothetical protein